MIASGAIRLQHRYAFWGGIAAVVAGVVAHLPMYQSAAAHGYRMAGMPVGSGMMLAMIAIVAGTLLAAWGVYPRRAPAIHATARLSVNDGPLTRAHRTLLLVLGLALIVDVMKPATLGFVMPGTALEYGLTKAQVAWLPLAGLSGTVAGSILWGLLGDRIGRRAAILLAAVIFVGTSICGAMPSYDWNLFMCFVMGLGAGGMLPITFALLAEMMPASRRGWLMVLLGGIGTLGGYLAASGAAALLEPDYSWRALWLLGLPTGMLLLVLNRYIPESPRFLIARGDRDAARHIMERFGMTDGAPVVTDTAGVTGGISALFQHRRAPLSAGIGLYGFSWGMVNFGFLLWLPVNLREAGLDAALSGALLANSALIAFPATVAVAWLYHHWSSRGTLVACAVLTTAVLGGFLVFDIDPLRHQDLLRALVAGLLVASSGVIAVLSPYAAEVYPLTLRATGSGWAAGASKFAGVAALGATMAGLTPAIGTGALLAAVPTAASAFLIRRYGPETLGRELDRD